jgi:predicted Fe-S protein YdhL (DUF1289 family)
MVKRRSKLVQDTYCKGCRRSFVLNWQKANRIDANKQNREYLSKNPEKRNLI